MNILNKVAISRQQTLPDTGPQHGVGATLTRLFGLAMIRLPTLLRPTMPSLRLLFVLALMLTSCASLDEPAGRSFSFTYGATITDLAPGAVARIWLPVAQNGAHQQIEIETVDVPGDSRFTTEERYGNRLLYTEARADSSGRIPLKVVYSVHRSEVKPQSGAQLSPGQRQLFLQSNAMVPVGAAAVTQLVKAAPEAVAPRQLYDLVDEQVTYNKPAGGDWGRGDALWVCDSGHGNCTDFHSLFIALCRGNKIPARFEMGFPLPRDSNAGSIGGYHCWAWFEADGRWSACDISEADKHPELKEYYFGHLTPDRLAFTVGRDLTLDPPQAAAPLNYLIYPYVEVAGVAHTQLEKQFSFTAD
ncbi:MAG: hypothetical protein ACI9EF_000107 [Pseudohongiellaceae bacterium]|jgi:hypothetical protein